MSCLEKAGDVSQITELLACEGQVRGNKKEGKMFENVTRQLAESVIETSYSSLPQEVIEKIKLMLLDSIGCALGGYITDRARIALELAEEFGAIPRLASLEIAAHLMPSLPLLIVN